MCRGLATPDEDQGRPAEGVGRVARGSGLFQRHICVVAEVICARCVAGVSTRGIEGIKVKSACSPMVFEPRRVSLCDCIVKFDLCWTFGTSQGRPLFSFPMHATHEKKGRTTRTPTSHLACHISSPLCFYHCSSSSFLWLPFCFVRKPITFYMFAGTPQSGHQSRETLRTCAEEPRAWTIMSEQMAQQMANALLSLQQQVAAPGAQLALNSHGELAWSLCRVDPAQRAKTAEPRGHQRQWQTNVLRSCRREGSRENFSSCLSTKTPELCDKHVFGRQGVGGVGSEQNRSPWPPLTLRTVSARQDPGQSASAVLRAHASDRKRGGRLVCDSSVPVDSRTDPGPAEICDQPCADRSKLASTFAPKTVQDETESYLTTFWWRP